MYRKFYKSLTFSKVWPPAFIPPTWWGCPRQRGGKMDVQIRVLEPENQQNTVVFQFFGEIHSGILNEYQMRQKVDYLVDQDKEIFIFHFLEADSIDSSTIGLMAKIAKHRKTVKVVCRAHGLVFETIDLVKLFSVIPRFDSIEAALSAP